MALLEVDSLDVYYGSIQALRGVSLNVDAGERVALLGPNGAGKSTTLRTVSGLLSPKKGKITFNSEEIQGLPAYEVVGKGVAHGPEGRALFPTLSVEENLRFGFLPRLRSDVSVNDSKPGRIFEKTKRLLLPSGSARAYAAQLAYVFQYFPILKERRKQAAGTLSGGEQQMLVMARALMSSPKLLIMDELSLGLAPKVVATLFDILREVNKEGTAVLIVEQFVHLALENTSRAYVLAKGEVVLEGDSGELLASPELMAAYLGGEAAASDSNSPALSSEQEDVPIVSPAGAGRRTRK